MRTILLDRRGYLELHDHIESRQGVVIGSFNGLAKDMQSLITIENAKRIIQLGGLPNDVRDGWDEMIEGFVKDSVMPEHTRAAVRASGRMNERIVQLRKQEGMGVVSAAIAKWVNEQGGALITTLTAAQMANAHSIIHHQVLWQVTSPYQLARVMRPVVGLTEGDAIACSRLYSGLLEAGVPPKAATARLEKYANYLHRVRADRIARTELSDAYNFGQLDSMRQARLGGLLPGEPEKSWIAGGPRPCEICLGNEADGPIPIDNTFSSGDDRPTAHPCCACAVAYSVRR